MKYYPKLFLILFVLFLLSCGHRKSPTGGKKDTESPTILSILPDEFCDINNQDIEVVFSKPIDRTSIFSGIYIYPPILNKKFKWDKNTLKIKILEDLEQNTNYFFTFFKRIKGEHNNKLDQDYVFIFRSGKLNEHRISGEIIYEDKSDEGQLVKFNLLTADSTLIYSTELEGYSYEIDNLNSIEHQIESYIDKNENGKYDYEKEPYFQFFISKKETSSVNIELAYADTIKPEIKSVNALWNNQLELNFSENIKSVSEIKITTSDSLEIPLSVLAHALNEDKITVVTTKMDTIQYKIWLAALEDLKENVLDESSILFDGISIQDTIPPIVISSFPRNGATIKTLLPEIVIEFSEIILTENLSAKLVSVESQELTEMRIDKGNSNIFIFKPSRELTNYSSYNFIITASDMTNNKSEEFSTFFIPIVRQE
ncbi:MAG: Ig-like domain-containing protein [Armatimonadetes bacterium]|nr:Ig-like domain-containing protein [Armatimonadota bacterium]